MKKLLIGLLVVGFLAFAILPLTQVSAADPIKQEMVELRTQTSKTYYLGGNKYSMDIKVGSVHYKENPGDTIGAWKEINNQFVPAVAPWNWQMTQDGYKTYVLNNFTAGQVLKFESQGSTVAFQPMGLLWSNTLNQLQQISMPQNVSPTMTNTPVELLPGMLGAVGTIRWNNAYGAGRDFSWTNTPGKLNKVLQLSAKPPAPPQYIIDGGNPVLKLDFIFAPSLDLDIYVDGRLWDKSSKKQTVNTIEFKKNGETFWVFCPIKYWGSDPNPASLTNEGIGVTELKKSGNSLYVSALVPYDWLQTAVYPVFIDPTLEVQVGASADDAFEIEDTGAIDLTSTIIYIWSNTTAANRYWGGFRFVSAEFPTLGTTIDVAYLKGYVQSTSYDDVNFNIHFEELAAPAAFTTDAGNITARDRTEASVAWIADGIGAGWKNSPSLCGVGSPAQELFDAYSPTAIVVIVRPNADVAKQLRIFSQDQAPNNLGAILHLEWTVATAPPTNFVASDNRTGEVRCTWTKSVGATKYQLYRDAAPVGAELGDVDTTDDATAAAPTITPGNAVASDGTSTAHIALNIAGESANDGTTYSYTVRAWIAATGWSGDSNADNGKRIPGALTYQWWRSANDGDAGYGVLGGATTEAHNDATAPAPTITAGNAVATDGVHTDKVSLSLAGTSSNDGAGRWYYCVLDATGCAQQTTGHNRGYRDSGALGYQWQVDRGAGWGNIAGAVNATYDDGAAPAGTVTPGVASASDGTSEAHSVLSLAGEGINDGATNNYRCALTAPDAAGQTSGANTGFRRPVNLTYQWYRSVADVDGGYVLTGGATTDPYNDAGFPANGDGRWVYCEVNATGAVAADSTHDRGFRAVAPTATSVGCSGFGRDWAIVNATVDTLGLPASVTEVGFDYGLDDTYGDSSTKTGTWAANDEFWVKLTNLTAGTVYHARAKAWNGVWGYGADFVFSTEGSPTLYEYLNTLGDAAGTDIYAGNWSYMQFTVGTVAHSLDFANIYVIRTGAAPGDAVLSIRHADVANKPTGTDLDIMTLDADLFSVALDWVKFDFPDNITLEAGESYALVLRCPNGTVANYLEWQWDAGGSLANAIAGKTTDSGITWTAEATADHLFEVWGEPVFEVVGAKVFTGYRETGDWLVVFTYRNYFTPYYGTSICRDNFYVRLLDDTTVIAQIGCPAWGYRPGSFYISKALANGMEWGVTDYKVRLYGDFGANPYSDYNIAAADWGGAVDPFLDAWVIQAANIIGDDLGIALTETIADKGEVLNAMGHIWFSIGIPYLNEIRPELFEQVSQKPPYEEEDYTHELQGETDWEERVGTQIAATLTSAGDLIGLDGDEFGGVITFIAFILVVSLLTLGGHLVIGLGVGYPILLAGAWFGLLSWVIVGVITFLAVAIFVYKVWLVR